MDTIVYAFIFSLVFTICASPLYRNFHRWTSYRFFNLEHFNRSILLEYSLCLSLVVLWIIFDIMAVFFLDAKFGISLFGGGINTLYLIIIYRGKEKYKDAIILTQNYSIIYEAVTKDIDRSRWYDRYYWVIDSLGSEAISFEDDIVLPVIIIEKFQITRLHSEMLLDERAKKIRKLPYFRQFKRQLNNLTASDILERVDKFNRDHCREFYHSADRISKGKPTNR